MKKIFQGKIDKGELVRHIVFIAFESLPMILVLTSVSSLIITVNTATELEKYGGRELIGAAITLSNLQEITPIFIAFAIMARCGTAYTAEIASMKISDQINALQIMKVDPLYYLLTPRLLAIILITPFILAISAFCSTIAGMLMANISIKLEYVEFLDSAWRYATMKEYLYPLVKTIIFNVFMVIVVVSTALSCGKSSKDVGLATSRASTMVIIGVVVLNGFLTPILYH
ncbi:MAG: ABC transporter permease [Candidatus Caenarcaniphilales bacterium]|nr:ABC transporter permease [Candidatus Caenarcaniphilales bacterium]